MNDPIEKEIHRRTRRSLITGIAATAIGIGGWKWVLEQEQSGGIPWPLRRALRFNESLGRILHENSRLTVLPDEPPIGKEIRVNGKLGIQASPLPIREPLSLHVSAPEGLETEFQLDSLRQLPWTHTTTEFKCIEGWTEKMSYSGVRFSDFLSFLKLRERYSYVALETPNGGYYVSIDIESMLHPQTLLAFNMNGIPISPAHGAPLRLLIPVKYGIKSLKNIGRVFFSNIRPPDYWAERGYDWYAGL